MSRPAIIVFNVSGVATARRVAGAVSGETFGLAGRVGELDRTFEDSGALVAELFRAGRPIVGVCAAGILVRL
ncbi:precorrin-3B C(17)-methyltransferase, partial [Hansschlegelia beijingensis]